MSDLSRSEVIEAFSYLDGLRESGIVNMFGAVPYMELNLGFEGDTARTLLSGWMKTFDGMTDVNARADTYLQGT